MTRYKYGDHIFIPFANGTALVDAHGKPRLYKAHSGFEANARATDGQAEVVEYVPLLKKPYTLEELSKMDGQPVLVESNDGNRRYAILDVRTVNHTLVVCACSPKDPAPRACYYGQDGPDGWLAYPCGSLAEGETK